MATDNIVPFDAKDWDARERRERMLSRRRRIRRGPEFPPSAAHDLAAGSRYRLKHPNPPSGYEIRYRRTRWEDLAGDRAVYARGTLAWVLRGKEKIGFIEFAEYKIGPWVENDAVFWAMDAVSTEAARLGDLLTLSWDEAWQVSGGRGIIELVTVWQSPRHKVPGVAFDAAERLLSENVKTASLLMVQVYPLEYDGCSYDGTLAAYGRRARTAALGRIAERRAGMTYFPGKAGDIGWLYRANPDFEVDPPGVVGEPKTTLLW